MKKKYSLDNLDSLTFTIKKPSIVFLYWDLGAGKTTLTQYLIRKVLWDNEIQITSPTYVYYNKYDEVYHFDLYRLENYDEFISIWGEEVFDNKQWIIFVEWPQILEHNYAPDYKIFLEKTDSEKERIIRIESN